MDRHDNPKPADTPATSGKAETPGTSSLPLPDPAARPNLRAVMADDDGAKGWLARGDYLGLFPGAALIAAAAGLLVTAPDMAETALDTAKAAVAGTGRGAFLLVGVAAMATAFFILFSGLGNRQLGPANGPGKGHGDGGRIGSLTWFCLASTAGTLSGLSVWAAAEPLYHLSANPLLAKGQGDTAAATAPALRLTHFHWALHPWALFAVTGVAIAWGAARRNGPIRPSAALTPFFGKRVPIWLTMIVDILVAIVALAAFAMVVGLGATQIDTALAELLGNKSFSASAGQAEAAARAAAQKAGVEADDLGAYLRARRPDAATPMIWVLAAAGIGLLAAVAGPRFGLGQLSWVPVALIAILAAAVLAVGPARYLFDTLVQGAGDYLSSLPRLSITTQPNQAVDPWHGWWTVFYLGTWVAMAPLVGCFLAAISAGRSVRAVMVVGFVLPAVFTSVLIGVLGGASLHAELFGGAGLIEPVRKDPATALYEMLRILGTEAAEESAGARSYLASLAAAVHIASVIGVVACGAYVFRRWGAGNGRVPPLPNLIALALAIGAAVLIWQRLGLAGWQMVRSAVFLLALPAALYLIAATLAFLRPVGDNGAPADTAAADTGPATAPETGNPDRTKQDTP